MVWFSAAPAAPSPASVRKVRRGTFGLTASPLFCGVGSRQGKRRATANRLAKRVLGFGRPANPLAIANQSARAKGEFVDFQVADFPLERLARNAQLRRRAARAGDPSL